MTASADRTLRVWSWRSGERRGTLRGHSADLRRSAISGSGTLVLSTADDGSARLWNLRRAEAEETPPGSEQGVTACAWCTRVEGGARRSAIALADGGGGLQCFDAEGRVPAWRVQLEPINVK